MGIKVDEDRLFASIRAADRKSPTSQDALWKEAARIYNEGDNLPKRFQKPIEHKITKSIVYQKVRRWGIAVKTERKKAGRPIKETNGFDKQEALRLITESRDWIEGSAVKEGWTRLHTGWKHLNEVREFLGLPKIAPTDYPKWEYFRA